MTCQPMIIAENYFLGNKKRREVLFVIIRVFCLLLGLFYSLRSATIGSTFVARRAGIQQASIAMSMSNTLTAAKVSGSDA